MDQARPMSGRHKWKDIRRKSGGRGSRDIRIVLDRDRGYDPGEVEMTVDEMKAVSGSMMGNGKASENTTANQWAMTAEICERLEGKPGRWSRIKAFFAWRSAAE
jgi:hypothetical protein